MQPSMIQQTKTRQVARWRAACGLGQEFGWLSTVLSFWTFSCSAMKFLFAGWACLLATLLLCAGVSGRSSWQQVAPVLTDLELYSVTYSEAANKYVVRAGTDRDDGVFPLLLSTEDFNSFSQFGVDQLEFSTNVPSIGHGVVAFGDATVVCHVLSRSHFLKPEYGAGCC